MRSFSSRAQCSVLALAIVALSACGDHPNSTESSRTLRPRNAFVGDTFPTTTTTPTITALTLSSSSAVIGGASAPVTAILNNPAPDMPGMVIHGYVNQGTARRDAGAAQVDCGGGLGVLPNGTCAASLMFAASNSGAGTGTLAPGAATFELQLLDGSGTALDTKTVPVTLMSKPTPTVSVSLGSNVLTVGGASEQLTATIQNPGPSVSNVSATCEITQGTANRYASATLYRFGSDSGVLANGTSTISGQLVASNNLPGQGTLVPGPATMEFTVYSNSTVLATQTVQVNLVSVAFFANPAFMQFNPGNMAYAGSNMLAEIQSLGYPVSQFSSLTDATWSQAAKSKVIVVPELTHDLYSAMSAAQRQTVLDFVNAGGTLITTATNAGTPADTILHGDSLINFIGKLWGYDITTGWSSYSGAPPAADPKIMWDAKGTTFEGGPDRLSLYPVTYGLDPAHVPFEWLCIYDAYTSATPTTFDWRCTVTVIRPRRGTYSPMGQIIVLGWSWWQAHPGTDENGWRTVLDRAIRFQSSSFYSR